MSEGQAFALSWMAAMAIVGVCLAAIAISWPDGLSKDQNIAVAFGFVFTLIPMAVAAAVVTYNALAPKDKR